MVNASKILTVSYGTFSCTLEGFDEPFSTMRSIAEYFRDLAADDRYFGAEPPTPDAEMLHRIAEREVNRRVEAQVEENGVVLRQVADHADTAEAPEPQFAETAAEPVVAETVAEIAPEIADEQFDAVNDSVAAKLARIRAAVARSRSETEPLLNAVFAEDELAEPETDATSIDDVFGAEIAEEGAEPARDDETDVTAETGDAPETADILDSEELTEVEPATDADAGAAKASVEQDELDAEPALADELEDDDAQMADLVAEPDGTPGDVDVAEDQTAETVTGTADIFALSDDAFVDATDDMLAESAEDDAENEDHVDAPDIAAMLDEAVVEPGSEETDAQFESAEDTPVDLSAMLAEIGGDDGTDDADDLTDAEIAERTQEHPVLAGMLEKYAATTFSDDADDEEPVDETATSDDEMSKLILSDTDRTDDGDGTGDHSEEAGPQVRVMKMRRADFDAEMFAEQNDPVDDDVAGDDPAEDDAWPIAPQELRDQQDTDTASDDDALQIRETLGQTGLSEADEDDLIQELVEVERETGGVFEPEVVENEASEDPGADTGADTALTMDTEPGTDASEQDKPATDRSGHLTGSVQDDPASVDRLLARAATALEDDEGTRRRSAIAHLKAAVAAVRADGDSDRQKAEVEGTKAMDRFREDLAHAVQPDGVGDDAGDETTTASAPAEPEAPRQVTLGRRSAETAEEASSTARSRRRLPPLMLVSEQRVDRDPETAGSDPVRPRRIQAADLDGDVDNEIFAGSNDSKSETGAGNIFGAPGDFKSYVAETGAEGVSELLEASLAFGVHVEGSDVNSRPQIMRRMLAQFPDGSVTREDGLRAFGVLLREGRILRVKRGRFLLPDTSRFHPGQEPEANSA